MDMADTSALCCNKLVYLPLTTSIIFSYILVLWHCQGLHEEIQQPVTKFRWEYGTITSILPFLYFSEHSGKQKLQAPLLPTVGWNLDSESAFTGGKMATWSHSQRKFPQLFSLRREDWLWLFKLREEIIHQV